MTDLIQVSVTIPDRETADQLADMLLKAKLAASVQLLGPITSRYWWKDERCETQEILAIIKTRQACFHQLHQMICQHHPYELPEIIALPIIASDSTYQAWVQRYSINS